MRALIQRVSRASVSVDGEIVGSIGEGLLVLLGVGHDDGRSQAEKIASKISRLRVFADESGKPNLSLIETGCELLLVSQFTLLGNAARGNRPSFTEAARPEPAERLYLEVADLLRDLIGAEKVATGTFGAMMQVALVNDGPYTLMLDTD